MNAFAVLVRARLRMLLNTARAATPAQKIVVGLLCVLGLCLAAGIGAASASLVRLAQGTPFGGPLSPAASGLVGHAFDYVFFFLLAGSVPFVAATLFGAEDVPLLLTTPVPPGAMAAAKLLDAAATNAAQFVVLGLPVLAGIGVGARLGAAGWLSLTFSSLLLLILPPALTACFLLACARVLGMRRVRTVVTLVSVALGLIITIGAVLGTSRASRDGLLNFGQGGTHAPAFPADAPAPRVPPAAWAAAGVESAAGGRSPGTAGAAGLLKLLLTTVLTAALAVTLGASVFTSDAFLEQGSGAGRVSPVRAERSRPASPLMGFLHKDGLYLLRDLVLLGQMGTALILFLVPFLLRAAQGTDTAGNDLYGPLALAMVGLIAYMVTSIASLSSVGLEGRGGWMVLSAPVSRSLFLRAKWTGAFAVSFGLCAVLVLLTALAFGLGPLLTVLSLVTLGTACFALSGLGVGLSGLFPRFVYENPAHRASVWALVLGFVLATGYLLLCGLMAGGAYFAVTQWDVDSGPAYLAAGVGFILLSGATGAVPVQLAARRLRDYEWD